MEDNQNATAESGADIPDEGMATPDTSLEEVNNTTLAEDDLLEEQEDFRGRNEELRHRFLECTRRIKEAQEAGDTEAEARAREERHQVGNEFVEANFKLAVHNSSSFLIGDSENRKDHLQSALLGMWEAFVGTDASKIDDIIVDDDGQVHAASGWDPDRGTFATLAGSHISGRARRSVKTTESAYNGMSYNTWSEKPKVDRARRELTETLGRTPTFQEIATAAGVTVATVRAVSTATPVSLQTLVSDDGSTTLGDMLADKPADDSEDLSGLAGSELLDRARQMPALDLMVLALRTGITGRPPLTVNRTADRLCVGRGAAQLAIKRALSALVPEKAVPETVSCAKCGTEVAYDWDNEPQLVLTDFDLPDGLDEMDPDERKATLAAWTEKVNAEHAREQDAYDKALVGYRAKARDAAAAFTAKHKRHAAQSRNDEQATAFADLLA